MTELPEVHYTKYEGDWCVVGDCEVSSGDHVIAVTKAGKRHEVEVIKNVGSNQYGNIYLMKWPTPTKYAKWTKRGDKFCLHVPKGYKEGDVVDVQKADGTIKTEILNVKVEPNYWYTVDQKSRCSGCGEQGPTGEPCQLCNEGYY